MVTEHPGLVPYAIVRQHQINTDRPRYDDGWVADLDDEQVRRYARLFGVAVQAAREKWSSLETIACEILSTQPYPVKRVMELYGLGRFRVTQKADLDNHLDVYRSENARPEDWLMLGNHDTASIWQVAQKWVEEGQSGRQGEYLAMRLRIPEEERTRWIARLSDDAGALAQAKFAELFVGPARNIMVYFTDLLGMREPYNRPGTVSAENWSLRIPPDYATSYEKESQINLALNIPRALATALRSRGEEFGTENRALVSELEG
jgi:4-alpha-glucanotransferase